MGAAPRTSDRDDSIRCTPKFPSFKPKGFVQVYTEAQVDTEAQVYTEAQVLHKPPSSRSQAAVRQENFEKQKPQQKNRLPLWSLLASQSRGRGAARCGR